MDNVYSLYSPLRLLFLHSFIRNGERVDLRGKSLTTAGPERKRERERERERESS
jgi:hypothetical protein